MHPEICVYLTATLFPDSANPTHRRSRCQQLRDSVSTVRVAVQFSQYPSPCRVLRVANIAISYNYQQLLIVRTEQWLYFNDRNPARPFAVMRVHPDKSSISSDRSNIVIRDNIQSFANWQFAKRNIRKCSRSHRLSNPISNISCCHDIAILPSNRSFVFDASIASRKRLGTRFPGSTCLSSFAFRWYQWSSPMNLTLAFRWLKYDRRLRYS